ncbi:MAG TPA: hypothetical protein VIF62_10745 [Labilithrix sp.]
MEVVLGDGTHLRGTVEALEPGVSATIRLKSGARQIVPWDDIVRIVPPGTPEPKVLPPAPPPRPPPPPKPPSRRVRVEVNASSPVRLEMSVDGGAWELACTSPCGVELPVDASYRIVRDGDQVKGFRLDAAGRDTVVVDVSLPSPASRGIGIALVIAGSIAMYAAYAVLTSPNRAYESNDDGGPLVAALGGGAVATLIGTIAIVSSGSGVTQSGAAASDHVYSTPVRTQASAPRAFTGTLFTLKF